MKYSELSIPHQFVDRESSAVVTESLYADRLVQLIYSEVREHCPALYRALLSPVASKMLSFFNYDLLLGSANKKTAKMTESLGIDLGECVEPPAYYDSPRKLFERQIRYWETRPMEDDPAMIVSPADAKVLIGSFEKISRLFIKEKFFSFDELIGKEKKEWLAAFRDGDFSVFRLTPDKYHYNHTPVSGRLVDYYEIDGLFHSCNPGAVIREASPFSKNRRFVSIIDTDTEGGTGVGLVCMVEVTALMIGDIVQCYSEDRYEAPGEIRPGMFLEKGCPKSLYLPGSSVDVVIFQKDRIRFSEDLRRNALRYDVSSRYSAFFGRPVVETDVRVRSAIAERK